MKRLFFVLVLLIAAKAQAADLTFGLRGGVWSELDAFVAADFEIRFNRFALVPNVEVMRNERNDPDGDDVRFHLGGDALWFFGETFAGVGITEVLGAGDLDVGAGVVAGHVFRRGGVSPYLHLRVLKTTSEDAMVGVSGGVRFP